MEKIQDQIKVIRSLINGYKKSQIIISAEQLGIFDKLSDKGYSSSELSSCLKLDPDRLLPILSALVNFSILIKKKDTYCLNEKFSLLNKNNPASQLGYIRHARGVMLKWTGLTECVKNQAISQNNFHDITGNDQIATYSFMEAMHANALPQANYLSSNFDFESHKILDIGAGTGVYSTSVGKKYLKSHGVLIDLPSVVKITKEYIQKESLEDRFKTIACDYNLSIPEDIFDDVFAFAIIHQENVKTLNSLLNSIYEVLKTNGRLFLTSFFLDDNLTKPDFSVMFAVEMLTMTSTGKTYTHTEINDILLECNFKNIHRVNEIPGPATLYVAEK